MSSKISCTCCHIRYASWEVKYFQDPGIYKFCYNCIKYHQTSPNYPSREIKEQTELYPAKQYFGTGDEPACSCCKFIEPLTTVTKSDGTEANFCQECIQHLDRSELLFPSTRKLVV